MQTNVTVPRKTAQVAHSIGCFSATKPKNKSRDKTFVFVSEISLTLCLHSRYIGECGRTSKMSNALFKGYYLIVLFHIAISMMRG